MGTEREALYDAAGLVAAAAKLANWQGEFATADQLTWAAAHMAMLAKAGIPRRDSAAWERYVKDARGLLAKIKEWTL